MNDATPIPDSPFYRRMGRGHRMSTGHELAGHLAPTGEAGIWRLVRTCCTPADEAGRTGSEQLERVKAGYL